MAFLVLLITLICYKLFSLRVDRKFDQWFFVFADKVGSLFDQKNVLVTLLILLLPVAFVGLVLAIFESALFGLAGVVLHVLILFYSFGRDNLLRSTEQYLIKWQQGDVQSAYHFAAEYFKVEQDFEANDLVSMQREVRTGIIYQWFEQLFLVLFWYLIGGPLLSLFIRLICLYEQWLKENGADTSMPLQLLHAIEWLPVRILGFTFTIAGNFTLCFQSWLEAISSWHMPTEKVLNRAGLAALGVCSTEDMQQGEQSGINQEEVVEEYAREISMVQDLLVRSLTVWLVLVAIVAIT